MLDIQFSSANRLIGVLATSLGNLTSVLSGGRWKRRSGGVDLLDGNVKKKFCLKNNCFIVLRRFAITC